MVERILFIDESGTGPTRSQGPAAPRGPVSTTRVAAGVLVEWRRLSDFSRQVSSVRETLLRTSTPEVKGSTLIRDLKPGIVVGDVLERLGDVLKLTDASVWVAACAPPDGPHPRYPSAGANACNIARHLLVDRVNGMARSGTYDNRSWLVVLDISSSKDLADMGGMVTSFQDTVASRVRSEVLFPEVLGGRSERWAPIQMADVFAYFAQHAFGVAYGLRGSRVAIGDLFNRHLFPHLKLSSSGRTVGWAKWPARPWLSSSVLRNPNYEQTRAYRRLL